MTLMYVLCMKLYFFICNYNLMRFFYQVNKLRKPTKFNMLDSMTSLINFKNNLKFNQIK